MIILDTLIRKLCHLGLSSHLFTWIMDFLTNRPQSVRLGPHLSSTLTLNTGSPQGCVLSPLLYSLYTYDCTPSYTSNSIIKFADDTTVEGLILGEDESVYWDELQKLTLWCSEISLTLNTKKTKELILDFKKCRAVHSPIFINGDSVEIDNLSWLINIMAAVKKTQQQLHFLRVLKKNNLSSRLLLIFFTKSTLTYCLTVWSAIVFLFYFMLHGLMTG